MKYRKLGRSNLMVSELCLGTMMFGDQTDASESARIVDLAREQGVNFIDTADVYTKGGSETIVGRCLRADRHRWVLASKLGNRMSELPNESRYSRKWIVSELEASLRRLDTDYLDIYYLHRDHEGDCLEESLRAIDDLIRAGKIRCFGLSNFRGWRIAEVVRLCERIGMPAPVVCQPYYNLLNRAPEVEILPACRNYDLGVAAYSPIARGVLTGKYRPDAPPAEGTRAARGDKRMHESEWRPESLRIAEKLAVHAAAKGVSLLHFACAWLLASRTVSAVIAGPRTLAQWQEYFAALEVQWDDADEDLIDSLVAPGHPSTPGYSDPQYPLANRRTA